MQQRQRGVTLKQIAERAGCSVTAVSKTLNGAKGTAAVSDETQQRVWAIAREMGYTPNYLARALQSGRTNCIGLVSRIVTDAPHDVEYWTRIFTGVQAHLRDANQDLVVVGPDRVQDELHRGIGHLMQRRVDALIVPLCMYESFLPDLEAVDAPIVYTDSTYQGRHPSVSADMMPGLREAFDHLVELGHREVVWVPLLVGDSTDDPQRDQAVRAECQARGLRLTVWPCDTTDLVPPTLVREAIELARQQTAARLTGGLPGTAVITYSERAAIGVGAALQGAGLRIPADVSLLSFDDFYAELTVPAMTVVSANLPAVGERSAALALELAEGKLAAECAAGLVERPASRLIVRASTGPAPR